VELAFEDRLKRKEAQKLKFNFPFEGNSARSLFSFVVHPALKLTPAPTHNTALTTTEEQIEDPVWYTKHEHLGAEIEEDHPLIQALISSQPDWPHLHLRVLAAMHLHNATIPNSLQFILRKATGSQDLSSQPRMAVNKPSIHPQFPLEASPSPASNRRPLTVSSASNIIAGKRTKHPNGSKLTERIRALELQDQDYFEVPSKSKDELLVEAESAVKSAGAFIKPELARYITLLKQSLPWSLDQVTKRLNQDLLLNSTVNPQSGPLDLATQAKAHRYKNDLQHMIQMDHEEADELFIFMGTIDVLFPSLPVVCNSTLTTRTMQWFLSTSLLVLIQLLISPHQYTLPFSHPSDLRFEIRFLPIVRMIWTVSFALLSTAIYCSTIILILQNSSNKVLSVFHPIYKSTPARLINKVLTGLSPLYIVDPTLNSLGRQVTNTTHSLFITQNVRGIKNQEGKKSLIIAKLLDGIRDKKTITAYGIQETNIGNHRSLESWLKYSKASKHYSIYSDCPPNASFQAASIFGKGTAIILHESLAKYVNKRLLSLYPIAARL
jgi:hypothetical protein